MIDLLLFLYISLPLLSFFASRRERRFLPLFIGSLCGLMRAILGYTIPAAATLFSLTEISALSVVGIVTMMLEALMFREREGEVEKIVMLAALLPSIGFLFLPYLNSPLPFQLSTLSFCFVLLFYLDKNLFYLTYYTGISSTALIAESYGLLSNFWENNEKGLLGLPWSSILFHYFFTFFAIFKLGELIYYFAFKKLFNEFYVIDS